MMSKRAELSNFSNIKKTLFPLREMTQGRKTHLTERRPPKIPVTESDVRQTKKSGNEQERREKPRNFKPSLGFLRPTLSSLAKSRAHMEFKTIQEDFRLTKVSSPEPLLCEELRDVIEEVPAAEPNLAEVVLVKEVDADVKITTELRGTLPTITSDEPNFSMSSNSFIIWEAHDDDILDLSRIDLEDDQDSGCSLACPMEINVPGNHSRFQQENIGVTPKFPCTKSTEGRTKRKLCFRSGPKKPYRNDRLRRSVSPPPDFDVTVNSAPLSPDYVRAATSYNIFSTPILNLSSTTSEDLEKDETVYYTPCGELY